MRWAPAQKSMTARKPQAAGSVEDKPNPLDSTAAKVMIGGKGGAATSFNFFRRQCLDAVTANLQNEIKTIYRGLAPRMAKMTPEAPLARPNACTV